MKYLTDYAKAWVGGVGAAVTAYAGTWTDDVRILGLFAIVSAIATYLVPNSDSGEVDQTHPFID